MTFYMLRDSNTGKYYKRGAWWVPMEEASVWTTIAGPRACLGRLTGYNKRASRNPGFVPSDPHIAVFEARELKCSA